MLAILFVRQILAYVEFEIRKIRTVVGTGEKGYAGDGGPAIECLNGEAYGCAFDINGNLYIRDGRNHTVRRIDKVTQVITTVAGTGGAGYSGDGGPATQATVNNLYSLTVDTNGDIYIVDRYNGSNPQSRLRHRHHQHRGRHQGAWLQQRRRSRHTSPDARAQRLLSGRQRRSPYRRYPRPADTPIGPRYRNNDHVCRGRREVNGKPATEASLMGPRAVCVDSKGNTYIAEREGNGVRKVDANGVMSTFADTGEPGYGGDGGPALAAAWGAPKAMRCDNRDDLIWWTLRTTQSGVSTLKPAPSLSSPAGIREATAAWSDRTAVASTTRAIYTSLTASITA